jgi:hypothetical protein
MDVSIVHSDVRVRPDLVVEVTALVDGKSVRVHIERDAIERLLGADTRDADALGAALRRNLETIRIAIEAYVLARGAPLDGYLVLAWRDVADLMTDSPDESPVARAS